MIKLHPIFNNLSQFHDQILYPPRNSVNQQLNMELSQLFGNQSSKAEAIDPSKIFRLKDSKDLYEDWIWIGNHLTRCA